MLTSEEFVRRWLTSILPEERFPGIPDWKRSKLVCFDPCIQSLPLPESSRRFLVEAGMPRQVYHLQFGRPDLTLPLLPSMTAAGPFPPGFARYRVLATEIASAYQPEQHTESDYWMGFLCLDMKANGHVVYVSLLDNYRRAFANTSIEQYAEFLLIMRDYSEWWYTQTEPHKYLFESEKLGSFTAYDLDEQFRIDRQEYANEIIARLQAVDPKGTKQYWREAIFGIRDLE